VEDNTPPAINGVGDDETIVCPAEPEFSVPTASDLCDPNPSLEYEDEFVQGSCGAEYSVTRTWTATDACGNSSTASQTINVIPSEPVVEGGQTDDVYAECGEEVVLEYPEITSDCGEVEIVITRSDGGEWGDPFEPGTETEICYYGVDECGNYTETFCFTVTVGPCGDEYCTLTQGFYGTDGGSFCNGMGTAELIESLLAQGNLVVGSNGNTMTFTAGNSGCIIELLPGQGPAKTISGANTCASHPGIQKKNGRIFNILLAQTITLGLNLRLSDDLADLPIYSDTLVTAPSSGCDEEGDTITGAWTKYAIPQSVYNLLSQNGNIVPTVGDLYALANTGLGGGDITGTTLSDISSAVDKINIGFDECRIGYFQEPVEEIPLQSGPAGSPVADGQENLILNAYPNPFNTAANISFTSPVAGHVALEVYSLTGARVATLFDGMVEAGQAYKFEFRGDNNVYQATYVVVVRTERDTKFQRILMVR
jgi:hypothetical protein